MSELPHESQRWLAYELHDGLLQWVIGAKMQLEAANHDTTTRQFDQSQKNQLAMAIQYLNTALDEGRALIGFLEQETESTSIDIPALLAQFVDSMQAAGARQEQTIAFINQPPNWPTLPSPTQWNVVRIAQQAVRNAMQHAGPATITLTIGWQTPSTLTLAVTDNGRGFDTNTLTATNSPQGHFGISSMHHRARLIGGSLEINSSRGSGCTVKLLLPLATVENN